MENPPILSNVSEKGWKHVENILRAILQGFYINLIKKINNGYVNCFSQIKTTANSARESLFAKTKSQLHYAIYTQLKSIFGKASYAIISGIPTKLIEELDKKFIKDC